MLVLALVVGISLCGIAEGAKPDKPGGGGGGKGGGGKPKDEQPAAGIVLFVPATAMSGETIQISVEPTEGIELDWVIVVSSEGDAVGSGESLPFEFDYTIPLDAIGPTTIAATAIDTNEGFYSVEQSIFVETAASLDALSVSSVYFGGEPLPKRMTLYHIGDENFVEVQGMFSDGVTRDVSSGDVGTTLSPVEPDIVEIAPNGALRAIGEGETDVIVSNSGISTSLHVTVDFTDPTPGDRTGGNGSESDLLLTYSGPIDLGEQEMAMPASGSIDLPVNVSEIRFAFHNNSALPELGGPSGIVESSFGGGSNANCVVDLIGNEEPPTYAPFHVLDGEVVLSLPIGGGKCVLELNTAGAGKGSADKLVVNNPVP